MRSGQWKSSRPMANRRAYRPDRHVYRQLRRGMHRRWSPFFWLQIAIGLAAVVAIVMMIMWMMR